MLQILIADDHALVRRGLIDLLGAHEGWKVCGAATDGGEAVALAEQLKPDVAVLDLHMPRLNGIEAAQRIVGVSPATAVLVLAGDYSERIESECLSAGARGLVSKSNPDDRVSSAIESLARGETFFRHDPAVPGQRSVSPTGLLRHAPGLTSREIEVTQLLAEGKTNWCIATILGISVRTVETHRANVMRKLGLQSVVELVHYAVRNRMVETLPTPGASSGSSRPGGKRRRVSAGRPAWSEDAATPPRSAG